MKSKSREELLRERISKIVTDKVEAEKLFVACRDFEISNLMAIEKLTKERDANLKKIQGAIKQTIKAHGPITNDFITSAAKRIHGALLVEEGAKPKKPNPYAIRGIFVGGIIVTIIYTIILALT